MTLYSLSRHFVRVFFAVVSLIAASLIIVPAYADPGERLRMSLNENWRFLDRGIAFGQRPSLPTDGWELISLPHTWNANDPFDDIVSYRRGESWYRRELHLPQALKDKRLFLHFEGVNQVASVYVNGKFAGRHKGGYTAFTIDITDHVTFDGKETFDRGSIPGKNILAVQVSNAHDPSIAPLSVGYGLYGGIYRDVWLVATNAVHFDQNDHGSSGIFIDTPSVTAQGGTVRARANLVNDATSEQSALLVHKIVDRKGAIASKAEERLVLAAGETKRSELTLPTVEYPALWSPETPNLYEVHSQIFVDGALTDDVINPLGFRWFSFDPDNGFFLNGEKYVLRGTNRHQDHEGLGSALSDAQHVRDLQWIKDMGANFLRLAHYPQDPAVLKAADRLGLLIWEEIPLVNYIEGDPGLTANLESNLREMIRQHYNHPSVILWGTMNEIFLWKDGRRYRQFDLAENEAEAAYGEELKALAAHLNGIVQSEDQARASAMAIHGNASYSEAGVDDQADVLGINVYNGWYSGVFDGFGERIDARRREHPHQVLLVSEYGAGTDKRMNSLEPSRFDYTSDWARMFHESYLRQFRERPFLAGTAIWNQFDFSQPHTGGSISHLNQKGMQRWDRTPKDLYYLYKANWNPAPFVYIASRDWPKRAVAWSKNGAPATTHPVHIYSTLDTVTLTLNGQALGTKTVNDVRRATWDVALAPGTNTLEAVSERGGVRYTDRFVIEALPVPARLSDPNLPFRELHVNVGAKVQFADQAGRIWIEDQPYRNGSFGYLQGVAKTFNKDDIIRGTRNAGLMFTYREGLRAYRFDVPDGTYRVELRLAEPDEIIAEGARSFDILANGLLIHERVDLAERYGGLRTARLRFDASAKGGEGIQIDFRDRSGTAVLSAISIMKK